MRYESRRFEESVISQMLGHFRNLVEGMAASLEQPILDLPMLDREELHRLLVEWNDTRKVYSQNACFQYLFEAQVNRTPEAIAVAFAGKQLTYRELNERANKLADLLMQSGIVPETLVALLARRSIDLLTAILAVFKAGAAYLPLDPFYPKKRISQVLAQSNCAMVLTSTELREELVDALELIAGSDRPAVAEIEELLSRDANSETPDIMYQPSNLAYVIYTSGSTGIPKGAMVEQSGMVNHLYAKIDDLALTERDKIAQTASQSFDISVWQFLAGLVVGGEVEIVREEEAKDPGKLMELVEREGITVLETVPLMLRAMIEEAGRRGEGRAPRLEGLRWVIVTGEALPPELCRDWMKLYPLIRMMNAYGPTECSDDVTHYDLLEGTNATSRLSRSKPVSPGNSNGQPSFSERCIHQIIEEQAELTPDSLALLFDDQPLSYHQLNSSANQLAHLLQSLGVGPESLVAVCLHRSADMILALLAVLKAGGGYVPIDPDYPPARLAFMLDDSGAHLLITTLSLDQQLFGSSDLSSVPRLYLDQLQHEIDSQSRVNPHSEVGGENLAYVIYTSGTTGKPKGAMNTHHGISNRLQWMQEAYLLDSSDRVLHKTPLSFDVSVWEVFWPLMSGAAVVVARPGGHLEPGYLVELIEKQEVTTMHFVPSMMEKFLEEVEEGRCKSVRRVIASGEAMSRELVEKYFERMSGELHNLYGPTEASVDVSWWECERGAGGRSVPIGRPIANTQIYILDKEMRAVPVGVLGELYLGGAGLGRGYLRKGGMTAERFVPNPYGGEGGSRIYRSGDIGRYREDGSIEYVGRVDHQVKIRGARIEIGEIESVMREVRGVREAVVVVREEEGKGKELIGYVVMEEGEEVSVREMREELELRLPKVMVPRAIVRLEGMPLSPNGKLDRKALPSPEQLQTEEDDFIAPRTPVEDVLGGIWSQVLKVEKVGINNNFFDLGGHSLLATQVASRVRESLGIEMPLRALFETATLADLAQELEKALRAEQGLPSPALTRVQRGEPFPLSFAQQRLWFLYQLEPASPLYHIPAATRLTGKLDLAALIMSFDELVRRHEVLRTTFSTIDGQPVQVIHPHEPVSVPIVDLSELTEKRRESEAQRLTLMEAILPFDITHGPLLRVGVVRMAEDDHIVPVTMHHIISDGWSMGVLIEEVAALYEAFSKGLSSPLADLPIQYADFTHWQRQWLQGEVLDAQLSYWKRRLQGSPPMLELPTDNPRPPIQNYNGSTEFITLPLSLTDKLKKITRQEGATLYMTLLSAFKILLYRYTGQEDILVGTPIASRNRVELEGLIGFFANTLVLRTDLSGNPNFQQTLGRVRERVLEAYTHQDLPFEKLVEELQPKRSLSHSPLFQVLFVFQNQPRAPIELTGLSLNGVGIASGTAKFDLTLDMEESGEGLSAALEYNTDLFEAATIKRMLGHFHTLLEAIAANPENRISDLAMLAEGEQRQLLVEWNNTHAEYATDLCMHQLFEAQAEATPDATALIFGHERLTYRELNAHANQLANYLQRLGVGPESLVAIRMERSIEMVVGMLAVLKAGGAYVPLDLAYPRERLAFMLDDAQARVVLTQQRLIEGPADQPSQIVCVDSDWEKISAEDYSNPTSAVTPRNLAYVIYTSGSVGRPKGVAIEHQSAVTMLQWARDSFRAEQIEGVLASTSICFDLSVFELFVPLSWGGKVILAENALHLPALPAANEVTLVNTVPSAITELARINGVPPSVTTVNLAGEPLKNALVEQVYRQGMVKEVYNLYGPSEDTTYSTYTMIEKETTEAVSIGRPIANTQVYLLDSNGQVVPVGVPAELHLGGDGLVRGYLNRPEMTAERFIPDPFSPLPGRRLYRTGDLARYRADGNIEFLGRLDHQVKIRGFRIEPGEVEAVLGQHPAVVESVVLAREDVPGDKRLVAYVAHKQEPVPTVTDLRHFLRQQLPDYMLPAAFVMLDQMPLTPNGKVDRRALPAPESARPELESAYVPPHTSLERTIAAMWQELLHVDKIGVHDNFFDLGGHSLLILQLHGKLVEVYGDKKITVVDLFQSPTISSLARFLSQADSEQPSFEETYDRAETRKARVKRQRQIRQRHATS